MNCKWKCCSCSSLAFPPCVYMPTCTDPKLEPRSSKRNHNQHIAMRHKQMDTLSPSEKGSSTYQSSRWLSPTAMESGCNKNPSTIKAILPIILRNYRWRHIAPDVLLSAHLGKPCSASCHPTLFFPDFPSIPIVSSSNCRNEQWLTIMRMGSFNEPWDHWLHTTVAPGNKLNNADLHI